MMESKYLEVKVVYVVFLSDWPVLKFKVKVIINDTSLFLNMSSR